MEEIFVNNNLSDFTIRLNVSEGHCSIAIDDYTGNSKNVVIPSSFGEIPVTAIRDFAFLRNEELTGINIPDGVTSIGDSAFNDCANLVDIKLPESLVSIGDIAFDNCDKLESIMLPKKLVHLDIGSFIGCGSLKEINVDKENPAFSSVDGVLFDKDITSLLRYPCGKIGEFIIPDSVMDTAYDAFRDCGKLTYLTIPQSLVDFSINFRGCEQLAGIEVHKDNLWLSNRDGVLFDKEGTFLLFCPNNKEEYLVPNSTIRIKAGAFGYCKRLKKVVLQEGLIVIDDLAFENCEQLTEIIFPMSLRYIGSEAFENCTQLQSITLSRKTKLHYRALKGFSGKLIYLD